MLVTGMIPFLTYPLALIALASLPALAAIYILRNRFRRRQVSSLMLWRFRVQSKEGGARVNRLQLPLLFFLELLALLLLVDRRRRAALEIAAGHPPARRGARRLVFDARRSPENGSAQTRARESLRKMFRFQPPPSHASDPRRDPSRACWARRRGTGPRSRSCCANGPAGRRRLRSMPPITLASELGQQQANILVLTDHAPADEKIANDRLQWRAFGEPVDNVAIVNASRTANGDQDRCLLEIANFSKSARSARLLVQTGSNAVQQTLLVTRRRRNSIGSCSTCPRARRSSRSDSTPMLWLEDNAVQLLPPIRKRVRVQVALTNSALSAIWWSALLPRRDCAPRFRTIPNW